MGGDLEHRVGRGVDDRLAGLQVLGAQLLDDLGARGGLVAEHAAADGLGEGVDHLGREAVGVGREGLVEDDPHHLPVAGGGVLAGRPLGHAADHGGGRVDGVDPGDPGQPPEPPRPERGQLQPADRGGGVPGGVGALVAVVAGVRRLPHPERVADDQDHLAGAPPGAHRPRGGSVTATLAGACRSCRGGRRGGPRGARRRWAGRSARRCRRCRPSMRSRACSTSRRVSRRLRTRVRRLARSAAAWPASAKPSSSSGSSMPSASRRAPRSSS